MSTARLSIAMAVYNGSRFIREQLNSFAKQSRLPDELVVCDDGSGDDTVEIVERFTRDALFPVRLYINEENIGLNPNFQKAIGLCRGDWVFMADHDDVWEAEKLARFEEVIGRSEEPGLVFSDATVVDEDLKPLGHRHWETVGFGLSQQSQIDSGRGFGELVKHCFVAGATMAFDARYKSLIGPIPDTWMYDEWIALLVSAVAPTGLVREPMNLYRQHAKQRLGTRRKGVVRKYVEAKRRVDADYFEHQVNRYTQAKQRLIDHEEMALQEGVLDALGRKIDLCRSRGRMRQNVAMRYPLVVKNLLMGCYHRYAHGWKTVLLDLVM